MCLNSRRKKGKMQELGRSKESGFGRKNDVDGGWGGEKHESKISVHTSNIVKQTSADRMRLGEGEWHPPPPRPDPPGARTSTHLCTLPPIPPIHQAPVFVKQFLQKNRKLA